MITDAHTTPLLQMSSNDDVPSLGRLDAYQKIVATVDLPGVPEGTTGKVLVSNGVTWYRYWVDFDNGVRLGQVGHQR